MTFAVAAFSDRLSALRLQPLGEIRDDVGTGMAEERDGLDGALYVLDSDLQIVLAWNPGDTRRAAGTDFQTRIGTAPYRVLDGQIRERSGIAKPVSFLVVRTHPRCSGRPDSSSEFTSIAHRRRTR